MVVLELPPRLSFSSLLRRGGEGRGGEGRREGMEGRGREEDEGKVGVEGRRRRREGQ